MDTFSHWFGIFYENFKKGLDSFEVIVNATAEHTHKDTFINTNSFILCNFYTFLQYSMEIKSPKYS